MLSGIFLGPHFLVKYFKIIGNIKKKPYETHSNTSIGIILCCAFNTHQKDALRWAVWLWYQYLLQRYELSATYKHFYQHVPYNIVKAGPAHGRGGRSRWSLRSLQPKPFWFYDFKNRLFQCTTNCWPAVAQTNIKKKRQQITTSDKFEELTQWNVN